MMLSYYAPRANLYTLWQQHSNWSHAQFAAAVGFSQDWVKKWLKRFREELAAGVAVEAVLAGHSRAHKHAAATTPPLVVVADPLHPRSPPRRLTPRARARGHSLLFRA